MIKVSTDQHTAPAYADFLLYFTHRATNTQLLEGGKKTQTSGILLGKTFAIYLTWQIKLYIGYNLQSKLSDVLDTMKVDD